MASRFNLGGDRPVLPALPCDVEVDISGVPSGKRLAGKAAADEMGAGRRRGGICVGDEIRLAKVLEKQESR